MLIRRSVIAILILILAGCSAKFLKIDGDAQIGDIKEYEKKLKVKELDKKRQKEIEAQEAKAKLENEKSLKAGSSLDTSISSTTTSTSTSTTKRLYVQNPEATIGPAKPDSKQMLPSPKKSKRLPEIEDATGFNGRRPIVDPFRVGERVTLGVRYLGMSAGTLSIETLPFKEVNGRKSYHFQVKAQSGPFFNAFYSVDDTAETFMDFEKMIPYNFAIHVKESKQLKEVRAFFDWSTLTANYWEHKVTKDKGEKTKKYQWKIPEYSQNIFSGPMYLRAFTLTPGKSISFRLADEKKNIIVTTEVLRREKISTPIGELNTMVIRPKIEIEGAFKPMGDVLFWVTDDNRKFIVKIEAKIKIGSIYADLIDLDPGLEL